MLPDPIESLEPTLLVPPAPRGVDGGETTASAPARPSATARAIVLLEVLICSDYPTQLALSAAFAPFGITAAGPDGGLHIGFVVALSLIDTALLIGLILAFLYAHGERPRQIFLGHRAVLAEAVHGVPLILTAILIGIAVLGSIQYFAPWLHNVVNNPLRDLVQSPRDAWLFALVVVVAGGIREEIQRAFLLHRFEVWLGGRTVGVVVTSTAFGAGHLLQGADAVIATGLLGAFWAVVYLRRRSVVAPMVSHAGFDLLQIGQLLVGR
ncbi:MAG: CPBP family intramembrane metalloprotease [Acidobacteria bacterium]|nr:CPBP family intramembrane metalloprotease [Acidobacteriota bacterium]